jgi:FkbM family methyltransferase
VHRFLRSVDYLFRRHVLRRPYLVATSNYSGLRLRVKTEDVIGRHLYKHGILEAGCIRVIERHVRLERGDVLIDVGANIGWYSLVLDRLAAADTDIYAFEPDPGNFELLVQNVAMNNASRVRPVPYALADQPGTRTLYLYAQKNRGRHSMLPINDGARIEIEAVTLDDFWQQQNLADRRPGFIKMDVEGYELFALRGARTVLQRCASVLIEYSPAYMRKAGVEPAELYDLLAGTGLQVHEIDAAGDLSPAERASVLAVERQRNLFWHRG